MTTRIFQVVIPCLLLLISAPGRDGVAASADTLSIYICHESDGEKYSGWRQSSLFEIARTLKNDESELRLEVHYAVCNSTMPDSSCSGRPGAMFCRQAALDRISFAAAWLVQAHHRMGRPGYEAFRRALPRAVLTAFRAADGTFEDSKAADWIDGIRGRAELRASGNNPRNMDDNYAALDMIHNRIVAYNLAALIGHEASHVFKETCPVTTRSAVEDRGLLDRIVALQTGKELFCPRFPDANEMRADRCAVRHIHRLDDATIGDPADPLSIETFARRAAADMIAFQALVGWRRFSSLPQGVYVTPELAQYFRPALRLVLLAAEVPDPRTGPLICGEAASLFVHAVQLDVTECADGRGIINDDILALLPSGVETSWNGKPWTADSLSCKLRTK